MKLPSSLLMVLLSAGGVDPSASAPQPHPACAQHTDRSHCLLFRLQDDCVWDADASNCTQSTPCDERSADRCEFELTTHESWDATQNKCFLAFDGTCQWSDTCFEITDAETCAASGCGWKQLCTPKDMRFSPGPGACKNVCVTPDTTSRPPQFVPSSSSTTTAAAATTTDDRVNESTAVRNKTESGDRQRPSPALPPKQTRRLQKLGFNLSVAPEILETRDGYRFRGLQSDAVELHLGVPFAAAPVGDLRWKPPTGLSAWNEVYNATDFGAGCMRASAAYDLFNDNACRAYTRNGTSAPSGMCAGYSEDCLSLNIYAPAGSISAAAAGEAGKPVMVWIHGGCFVMGEGSKYNGTNLAINQDVLVVTVNYRLAAFGFLAHDALRSRDQTWGSTGNYGLLDNVAALEWIQRNIADFGGDPNRVTIFGESSGAGSVSQLLGSPMAWPFFHAAIMESGLASFWTYMNMAAAYDNFEGTLTAGGCADAGNISQKVNCLLGASSASLAGAVTAPFCRDSCSWTPVIDGVVVPGRTISLARQGRLRPKTPIIAGYNLHDGGSFVPFSHDMTPTDLETYFATRFGPNVVTDLESTYPSLDIELPSGCSMSFMRASSCETDWSYACETHMVADGLAARQGTWTVADAKLGSESRLGSKHPNLPGGFDDDGVFVYEFSQVTSSTGLCLHGADVAYVFGTVSPTAGVDALAVAAEVQQLWGDFARSGVPSPTWPRWSASAVDKQLLNITAPKAYVTRPAQTCPNFFEPRWDYYKVCLPDNPDLEPM